MLTHAAVTRAIIRSLTPDLLSAAWRARVTPDDPPATGHCAIASEAFYYLCGGGQAGLLPVVCGYYESPDEKIYFPEQNPPLGSLKSTHWWVRGPKGPARGLGKIFDVSVSQYKGVSFPYERGRGTGFMQPQKIPSRRAQIIIDRVEALLGKGEVAAFRRENIRRFQAACRKAEPALR